VDGAVPQMDLVVRRLPARAPAAVSWRAVFESLPAAALVLGADGALLACNPAARVLLGPSADTATRCCQLLGCRPAGEALGSGCVGELARAGAGALAERQVQLHDGAAAWLTAAPAAADGQVVVMLHRLAGPAGMGREDLPPRLCVRALGRTRLETGAEPLAGEWLSHRPGQLLKYLVCERGRVITLEELIEVFWPNAGRAAATSVRQAIHTLRDRLEPDRPKGKPSGYVVARTGGYELTPGRVWIDADDFEAHARAGLEALRRGASERAGASLTAAADAYEGDFLADEPYAEWALVERERMRDLAAQVLRGLAGLKQAAGDDESAGVHLQRLAELEPLDLEAQRDLLGLMLRRGRHSEALRRYELVRRRYKRAFGTEPGFTLAQLAA
jgi:DNA-binding SARP family transcriptional activator